MDTNENIGGNLVPCYDSKVAAEGHIEELENATYYLRHGEVGRPSLSPRYVVRGGKRRYYVFAEYNYYYGTFGAPKDGPYERAE